MRSQKIAARSTAVSYDAAGKKIHLGKIQARVDFDNAEFDKQVEESGQRVLWERALECPHLLNDQTRQANPNCEICGGTNYFYVKPNDGWRLEEYDLLDPPFLDTEDAVATQLIVQSVTKDPQVFEKFGEWVFGTVRVTPFSFNRVDYKDRLTLVDASVSYRQLMRVPAERIIKHNPLRKDPELYLRYKAIEVREAYAVDGRKKTSFNDRIAIDDDGAIVFTDPDVPATGTRLALSYSYRPILIVLDHVYAWRDIMHKLKTKSAIGETAHLPHHAMARLDFLVSP